MLGKRLLHDKVVLFLVLVTGLMMVFSLLMVLLRVDTSQQSTIIRYNTSLGLAGFERGPSNELFGFVFMALIIGVGSVVLMRKLYYLRRNMSLLVLSLAIVGLLFNIVVSGALLNLQ